MDSSSKNSHVIVGNIDDTYAATCKEFNKYQISNTKCADIVENNCSVHHHHVLKEKMPNNNIVSNYSNSNSWSTEIIDSDVMNASKELFDVKDDDTLYNNKFKFKDAREASSLVSIHNAKRKLRTRSDSDTIDNSCTSFSPSPWVELPINNNSPDKRTDRDDFNDEHKEHESKVSENVTILKGRNAKKSSPPVHRVLLYNNQSPRLPRFSGTSLRFQEARHTRNKSPLLTSKSKQLYNNKSNATNCYVHVAKSHNQIAPSTVKMTNSNQKIVQPSDIGINTSNKIDNTDDDDDDDDDDDIVDLDNVSDYGDSLDDSDSSSDSEDGYRSYAYKVTHSMERHITKQTCLSFRSSEESLINPDSILVPSLFPNVPPYLSFSSSTCKGPQVPAELYRVLKWRVTNVMPKVVRCVLSNSGMRLLKKTNDWMGTWGKHMKSPCFKTIRPYQKINHLPGSFKIGRKDACWKNLQKQMMKHGKKDFGFMPKTYIIPNDLNLLRKNWPKYAQRNIKWIIKPPASARGAGIRVVNRWAQIPKRKPLIVQKYIERPLLINGSKFDLRLYVLVTSINPLRVFMYHNGLARFASVKYSDKSDTLNDRCMHLTNYSINKFSSNYSKNEDVNACHGHKWTIKSLWNYLENRGVRTDCLWEALRNLVLRTLLAGEQSISNMIKMNVESKYSCFELFGFDVLLDADLIPWLLEVNISPSLHSELPLDAHVKAPLVQSVLNTALFHVPPKLTLDKQKEIAIEMSLPAGPICYDKRLYINYLSRAEKIKHNTFTRKAIEERDEYINSILDHLTPDDLRCLIVAEDELARCTPLERIFPTSQTYKYLKYTESPRYYNRLLDAWESRYGNNRAEGIALLREYCEDKYHLEIPPSPAKKHLKYRTRAIARSRPIGLALPTTTTITKKWKSQRIHRISAKNTLNITKGMLHLTEMLNVE